MPALFGEAAALDVAQAAGAPAPLELPPAPKTAIEDVGPAPAAEPAAAPTAAPAAAPALAPDDVPEDTPLGPCKLRRNTLHPLYDDISEFMNLHGISYEVLIPPGKLKWVKPVFDNERALLDKPGGSTLYSLHSGELQSGETYSDYVRAYRNVHYESYKDTVRSRKDFIMLYWDRDGQRSWETQGAVRDVRGQSKSGL